MAGIYLSADSTVTAADRPLTNSMIAPLNGGAVDSRTLGLWLPNDLTPGTYYIGAIADSWTSCGSTPDGTGKSAMT